jgi:hypothetical protein
MSISRNVDIETRGIIVFVKYILNGSQKAHVQISPLSLNPLLGTMVQMYFSNFPQERYEKVLSTRTLPCG